MSVEFSDSLFFVEDTNLSNRYSTERGRRAIDKYTAQEEEYLRKKIYSIITRREHWREETFEGSRLAYCNFSSLKMRGSVFRGVEFSDCRTHQAKCERADFRKSLDFVIDPRVTQIRGAKFSVDGALTLLSAFDVEIS